MIFSKLECFSCVGSNLGIFSFFLKILVNFLLGFMRASKHVFSLFFTVLPLSVCSEFSENLVFLGWAAEAALVIQIAQRGLMSFAQRGPITFPGAPFSPLLINHHGAA